jgi:DNA-binding PadR family transcriptional regulator
MTSMAWDAPEGACGPGEARFLKWRGPSGARMFAMRGPGGPGRGGWGGPMFFGFGGPPFGGPPFGGRGPHGRRGGRARRGDVRLAALLLLAEEPRNGYSIMQEIEQRSEGAWRASPGSVYPALSQLEDEGLIRSEEHDGRRVYAITDAGRAALAERPEGAPAPWEAVGEEYTPETMNLWNEMRQTGIAAVQVAQAGDAGQSERASAVLADARRALYRILAGDEPGAPQ